MSIQVNSKFKIAKPAHEVFEAFVDPALIANFWFSSSSKRWEQGETVTLRYEEYNAVLDIQVIAVEANKSISYEWGDPGEVNLVEIAIQEIDAESAMIEVNESGFDELDPEYINKLLGQKAGWVYVLSCLKAYLEYGAKIRGAMER